MPPPPALAPGYLSKDFSAAFKWPLESNSGASNVHTLCPFQQHSALCRLLSAQQLAGLPLALPPPGLSLFSLAGDVHIAIIDRSGQLEVEVIEARGLTPKPGSKSLPGEAFGYGGPAGQGYATELWV